MMKSLLPLMSLLLLVTLSKAEDVKWTHRAEEGEDATSTHYYFFLTEGDEVTRVRWVWNGGAQNKPEVTEFLLNEGGKITIRTSVADRTHVEALVAGKEAPLTKKRDYSIITADTSRMLIPPPPDKTLTDEQRIDIYNLISLLAKARKPINGKP